jgi:hypothetical protein
MKRFVMLVLIFIPIALLYRALEYVFGDTWITVGVFAAALVLGRAGLFVYRKSKGIKDEFLN